MGFDAGSDKTLSSLVVVGGAYELGWQPLSKLAGIVIAAMICVLRSHCYKISALYWYCRSQP